MPPPRSPSGTARTSSTTPLRSGSTGSGLPANISGTEILLEQRSGLSIAGTTSITATRLELISDRNVAVTGIGTASIGTLVIQASGSRTSTATVYDPATYNTVTKTVDTGDVFIDAQTLTVTTMDIRARLDVSINLTGTGTTAVNLRGAIGGLTTGQRAQSLLLTAVRPIELDHMTITANTVSLQAAAIQSNTSSIVRATSLDAQTTGGIMLWTDVDTVNAVSSAAGSIYLRDAGDIVLQNVLAQNGAITVNAAGNLTATSVITANDAADRDVRLSAGGNAYIDYVDAGQAGGQTRQYSKVIVRAKGSISEPVGKQDNVMPSVVAQRAGFRIPDIITYQMLLMHDGLMATPKLITSESDTGTDSELEVVYTATANAILDDDVPVMPTTVSGNYVLDIVGYYDDIDLTVTGDVLISGLPL